MGNERMYTAQQVADMCRAYYQFWKIIHNSPSKYSALEELSEKIPEDVRKILDPHKDIKRTLDSIKISGTAYSFDH